MWEITESINCHCCTVEERARARKREREREQERERERERERETTAHLTFVWETKVTQNTMTLVC